MHAFWIPLLLFATLAWGQGRPVPPPEGPPPTASPNDDDDKRQPVSTSQVAPDAPVLTIKGFCPTQTGSMLEKPAPASCQTIITRAEFEKLANAISPGMRPSVQRQLANAYPRLLVMSHDAEQRGLDRTPRVAELQRFSRLQILSQEMVHQIQQEAANISEQTIDDYYRNNSATFERATFERIFVPLRKQTEQPPEQNVGDTTLKPQQTETEAAMSKQADDLRLRALAGEDFTTLQQAAYVAAGIKAPASSPDMGPIRRTNFPAAHLAAFDMKVGEVSQVITDGGGHFIYRLKSKQLQPIDAVKEEIGSTLQNRNTQEAMKKILESFTTEMNPDFFGADKPSRSSAGSKPDQSAQPKQ